MLNGRDYPYPSPAPAIATSAQPTSKNPRDSGGCPMYVVRFSKLIFAGPCACPPLCWDLFCLESRDLGGPAGGLLVPWNPTNGSGDFWPTTAQLLAEIFFTTQWRLTAFERPGWLVSWNPRSWLTTLERAMNGSLWHSDWWGEFFGCSWLPPNATIACHCLWPPFAGGGKT